MHGFGISVKLVNFEYIFKIGLLMIALIRKHAAIRLIYKHFGRFMKKFDSKILGAFSYPEPARCLGSS